MVHQYYKYDTFFALRGKDEISRKTCPISCKEQRSKTTSGDFPYLTKVRSAKSSCAPHHFLKTLKIERR